MLKEGTGEKWRLSLTLIPCTGWEWFDTDVVNILWVEGRHPLQCKKE
jgi:hypothetical protein